MATLHIASKADKAKAGEIEAMIDNGELPHPPALDGKANTCAKCGKTTLLARFYIPGVGWSCEKCFDDWRTTPVWCSTRASDVHIGCVHIIPQCVIDADDKYKAQVDDLILKALDRVEKQQGGGMIETLAQLLDRIETLIVPVRGHSFVIYRENGHIIARIGIEHRRFPGNITLLELRPHLENYNPGDWQ
jgi:ribosomal protein S27AE